MFKKLSTSLLLCLITFGAFFGTIQSEEKPVSLEFASTTFAVESSPIPSGGIDELNAYVAEQQNNSAGGSKGSSAGGSKGSTSSQEMQKMYQAIAEGLNIFLGFITLIVSPAVMFAGWLMSPDWTSGDLFGLREVFYKLWITISNITYFIYAILLVFIALATMFGSDHYGYKALLPKLALGILMVPFTWWAVQFVISLSTIVTASVMSIPHETYNDIIDKKSVKMGFWEKETIPKEIIIESNQKFDTVLENTSTSSMNEGATCSNSAKGCISPRKFMETSGGMYGYMMVYAYGIFKIDEVKKINTDLDAVKSLVEIINQGLVGSIMFLVFGILTLALIFMLMTRAMMLWVYTIFSPFLTLDFVLGGSLLKGVGDSFSIKEFIGLAFVPAVVGLSLSFGLVIVGAVTSGGTSTTNSIKCDEAIITTKGCTIMGIMGNPENKITRKVGNISRAEQAPANGMGPSSPAERVTQNIISIGGIDIVFQGNIRAGDVKQYASSTNDTIGIISAGGGIFGTIIVDLIAIMFIWIAFMAAKGINKVVSAAAAPFEDLGKKVGTLAKDMPKYTPIPGLGVSASGLGKVATNAENYMTKKHEDAFKSSDWGKLFGGEKVVSAGDESKVSQKMSDAAKGNTDAIKDIRTILADIANKGQNVEYSKIPQMIIEGLKGLNKTQAVDRLKELGYSSDAADTIYEKGIKQGKFDINNPTLVSAFKSTSGAKSADGTPTGINIADGTNEYTIKIDNKLGFKLKKGDITNSFNPSSIDDDQKKYIKQNITRKNFEDMLRTQLSADEVKNLDSKLDAIDFKDKE